MQEDQELLRETFPAYTNLDNFREYLHHSLRRELLRLNVTMRDAQFVPENPTGDMVARFELRAFEHRVSVGTLLADWPEGQAKPSSEDLARTAPDGRVMVNKGMLELFVWKNVDHLEIEVRPEAATPKLCSFVRDHIEKRWPAPWSAGALMPPATSGAEINTIGISKEGQVAKSGRPAGLTSGMAAIVARIEVLQKEKNAKGKPLRDSQEIS